MNWLCSLRKGKFVDGDVENGDTLGEKFDGFLGPVDGDEELCEGLTK